VKRFSTFGLLMLLLVGGCPLADPASRYQTSIDVQIGITTTSGEAPMHVVVSAAQSTSANGAIVQYVWDFAGQAHSEEMAAEHTFYSPGRYPITLTVVNAAGEQASASIYVRVSGGSVTAVISADRLSGPAPLGIQFDGSASTAVDDTILDYYWNFGDGGESRQSAPVHVYNSAGTYTVTLQVVSAGGVSGVAEATVTVGEGTTAGSLQFNGTQYANLPAVAAEPLTAFTFEAWCSPDTTGGTLVNFGVPNVGIDVSPTDGAITVRAGGESFPAAAGLQTARWQHVAVSYASDGGATVYLDGTAVGTLSLEGEFSVSLLSLGAGFEGKITRVRFWSVSRSDTEVAADVNGNLTGFEEGLLGDWPLSAGSGQTLQNNADGGEDGTLGASDAQEPADPAWSTDSP
jgi:PKD repeat protein